MYPHELIQECTTDVSMYPHELLQECTTDVSMYPHELIQECTTDVSMYPHELLQECTTDEHVSPWTDTGMHYRYQHVSSSISRMQCNNERTFSCCWDWSKLSTDLFVKDILPLTLIQEGDLLFSTRLWISKIIHFTYRSTENLTINISFIAFSDLNLNFYWLQNKYPDSHFGISAGYWY